MKNDITKFVFAVIVLVFTAAAEELSPKLFGVGFPFLLISTIFLSPRHSSFTSILFAIAAGSIEDAICALPFATSVCFFTFFAFFIRSIHSSLMSMFFVYPLFQFWIWLWQPMRDDIALRLLSSFLLGPTTAVITIFAILWLERKAALDE